MRFAKNRLYIEKYVKCPNCGMLLFEPTKGSMDGTHSVDGKLYCSVWCAEWEADRSARCGSDGAKR